MPWICISPWPHEDRNDGLDVRGDRRRKPLSFPSYLFKHIDSSLYGSLTHGEKLSRSSIGMLPCFVTLEDFYILSNDGMKYLTTQPITRIKHIFQGSGHVCSVVD